MSQIDPALLQAQWAAMQGQALPTSAVMTPYQQQQYAPIYQQYAPPQQYQQPQYEPQRQETGEYMDADRIQSIADYIGSAEQASVASAQYIQWLETALVEHFKLMEWSQFQNQLIEGFLYDRDFALEYARYGWTANPIDDDFANKLANVYMEIHAQTPFGIAKAREDRANKPINFAAQVPYPQQPNSPPYVIPPLPNSGGNGYQAITLEQMSLAAQNGQLGQARAAALQNPLNLYAALLSQSPS